MLLNQNADIPPEASGVYGYAAVERTTLESALIERLRYLLGIDQMQIDRGI